MSFETQHGCGNERRVVVAIMGRGRESGTGLYLVLTLSKLRKMQAGGFCVLSYQKEGRRGEGNNKKNKKNKKLLHIVGEQGFWPRQQQTCILHGVLSQ